MLCVIVILYYKPLNLLLAKTLPLSTLVKKWSPFASCKLCIFYSVECCGQLVLVHCLFFFYVISDRIFICFKHCTFPSRYVLSCFPALYTLIPWLLIYLHFGIVLFICRLWKKMQMVSFSFSLWPIALALTIFHSKCLRYWENNPVTCLNWSLPPSEFKSVVI